MLKTLPVLLLALFPLYVDAQGNSTTVTYGIGYEDRGGSGAVAATYGGLLIEQPYLTMASSIALDAMLWDLEGVHPPSFRSLTVEAGTGEAIFQQLQLILRMQLEQFSTSDSSLYSLAPRIQYTARHLFVSGGINFRVFNLANLLVGSSTFYHTEKQFMFSLGGRFEVTPNVNVSLQMTNFDEYMAGSFATIGYLADLSWHGATTTVSALAGYRPSGVIALASCPLGWIARIIVRKEIR